MAIAARTSTIAENATTQTITGTLPTDRQAGDYVIGHFAVEGAPANFTGPGGSWTQLVAPRAISGTETMATYGMFDPASGPTGTTTAAAGRFTCIVQAWGGVDSTTPLDVAALVTAGTAQTLTLTQITTLTDGARLVSGVGGDFSTSGVITQPAGMTLDQRHGGGGRGAALAEETRPTAGATGTRAWTTTATAGLAFVGYLLALKPAVTAPASQFYYVGGMVVR